MKGIGGGGGGGGSAAYTAGKKAARTYYSGMHDAKVLIYIYT